jgi:hypothetical protein
MGSALICLVAMASVGPTIAMPALDNQKVASIKELIEHSSTTDKANEPGAAGSPAADAGHGDMNGWKDPKATGVVQQVEVIPQADLKASDKENAAKPGEVLKPKPAEAAAAPVAPVPGSAPKLAAAEEASSTQATNGDESFMDANHPVAPSTASKAGGQYSTESVVTPKAAEDKSAVKTWSATGGDSSAPASSSNINPGVLDVTIVCPTVRRFLKDGGDAPRYLEPAIHKMYDEMTEADKKSGRVKFLILNSDKEPQKHKEAIEIGNIPGGKVLEKPSYDQYLGEAIANSAKSEDLGGHVLEDGRSVGQETMKWVSAENLDGAHLFDKAAEMSPWVLFMEDDVKPTNNFLYKLTEAARYLESKPDMLFLDLYTPKVDWKPGSENVQNYDKGTYDYFCCTQAMLFKSENVRGVGEYWRQHATEPVDDNLVKYMREGGHPDKVYATWPNLIEHVGAYSSNPDKSTGIVEHESAWFDKS